jgi:hypothetical protein
MAIWMKYPAWSIDSVNGAVSTISLPLPSGTGADVSQPRAALSAVEPVDVLFELPFPFGAYEPIRRISFPGVLVVPRIFSGYVSWLSSPSVLAAAPRLYIFYDLRGLANSRKTKK